MNLINIETSYIYIYIYMHVRTYVRAHVVELLTQKFQYFLHCNNIPRLCYEMHIHRKQGRINTNNVYGTLYVQ
jgi:hypothetical protein